MIKIVSKTVKTLLYSLESYQSLLQIENLDVQKESNIILFCSMLDEERWDGSTLQWFDNPPDDKNATYIHLKQLQKILQKVATLLPQEIDNLATLDAVLTSLNCAISKMGIASLMENFEITYENLQTFIVKNALDHLIIEEAAETGEEQTKNPIILNTIGINLLQFVKMVIGHMYSNDSESTESIVNGVLEYSRIKCEVFNTKMDLLREKIKSTSKPGMSETEETKLLENSKTIQEQEFEVISTISEIINTLIPYLHAKIDEDVLYTLISTHIESIQKAAYLSLVYFYENFTPPLKFKYEPEPEQNEEELKQQIQQEMREMGHTDTDQDEEEKKEGDEAEETKVMDEDDQVEVLKHQRIKGEPDKNIPIMMLEIIERPPEIKEDAHEEEDKNDDEEIVTEGFMQVQSASTLLDQKVMSSQIYSYFLGWNAMLAKIANAKMKLKFEQDHEYLRTINSLQEFLTMNEHVYQMFLILLSAFLPQKVSKKMSPKTIIDCKPEWIDLNNQPQIENFALFTMYSFTSCFPSLVREYYSDHKDRKIFKLISPAIMANEIRKIETAQASLSTQNLSFTLFKSTQEILADYVNNEVEVQLKLQIPNEYPLKSIEVKCTKQLKMPEMKLRRWMLSISKMINSQNGDFISGILLWKDNIEKEIEGVEDCLICYCTVHVIDKSLPKLACKNCKNKFHAHCIRKWFAESQKSKCPMCQSYFW